MLTLKEAVAKLDALPESHVDRDCTGYPLTDADAIEIRAEAEALLAGNT